MSIKINESKMSMEDKVMINIEFYENGMSIHDIAEKSGLSPEEIKMNLGLNKTVQDTIIYEESFEKKPGNIIPKHMPPYRLKHIFEYYGIKPRNTLKASQILNDGSSYIYICNPMREFCKNRHSEKC